MQAAPLHGCPLPCAQPLQLTPQRPTACLQPCFCGVDAGREHPAAEAGAVCAAGRSAEQRGQRHEQQEQRAVAGGGRGHCCGVVGAGWQWKNMAASQQPASPGMLPTHHPTPQIIPLLLLTVFYAVYVRLFVPLAGLPDLVGEVRPGRCVREGQQAPHAQLTFQIQWFWQRAGQCTGQLQLVAPRGGHLSPDQHVTWPCADPELRLRSGHLHLRHSCRLPAGDRV